MASRKQIEANRLNSQKSTGPRSAEGKAASRMNALQSGIDAQSQIIRGEDPADLESLAAEYFDRFQPATPEERHYVDTLIRGEWQIRRLARADAQLWEHGFGNTFSLHEATALGQVFTNRSQTFMRLERRVAAAERSYKQALHELERLQHARTAAQAADPPAPASPLPPQPQANSTPSPQIGFVPQPPAATPLDPPPSPQARNFNHSRRAPAHAIT